MKRFTWLQIILCPSIAIKAVIAFAICFVFALIYMAIFGDDSELSTFGSILLLVGSVALSNFIVNKFLNTKK